jgi:hypothetical protein
MHKSVVCAVLLLLSSHLYAGGSHINFAVTENKIENGDYHLGGEIGIDMIKTLNNGFEVGGAIDASMFMVKSYQSLNDDAGKLVDFLFRIGYNFNNTLQIPFTLRGGIGYGLVQIGSNTMQGVVFDVAGEYDFANKYGIGIKYKTANMTLTLPNDPKIDYSQMGCYLTVKF